MKAKLLAAAALVALGASVQAATTESDTYCVITLPVYAGYNLYGVSVNPVNGTDTDLGDIVTFGDGASLKYCGSAAGVSDNYSNDADGRGIWLTGGTAGTIREFGLDAGTISYTISAGSTRLCASPVALTFPTDFSALETGSYRLANPKSNQVHIWDAEHQAYVDYYFKASTSGEGGTWTDKNTKAALVGTVTIPAGQGFYVQVGTQAGSKTLTFGN